MRRVTAALVLIGSIANPALAQTVTPAAPNCSCVQPSSPAPRLNTYHRAVARRRPAAPAPSYSTSITPGPFAFTRPQETAYAPLNGPPPGGYAQFDSSGTFSGLGPNGLGLLDASITDGVMGGPAGYTGPGPYNIGW